MKVYMKIRMKAEFVYNLLLSHTYSGLSGFLISLLGLAVIITGDFLLRNQTIQLCQAFVHIAVGVITLMFTPISLRLQTGRMMGQPRYDLEMQYGFDEDGTEEKMGEQVRVYDWNTVQKAVPIPRDVTFYIEESSTLVFPKGSFRRDFVPTMKLMVFNLSWGGIYIR